MSLATTSFEPLAPPDIALEGDPSWMEAEYPAPSVARFTVEQYQQMVSQGIIEENNQIEFLEGILVYKMTKKPAHWIAAKLVSDALEALRIPGYFVHRQDPVDTSDSVPEPDAALVRGEPRNYLSRNPQAAESCLVIEVADTSLVRDRRWKKRIYARAGVPTYWIVNLMDRQVEVFTQPSGLAEKPDYAGCQLFGMEEVITVVIDGRDAGRIAVKEILP